MEIRTILWTGTARARRRWAGGQAKRWQWGVGFRVGGRFRCWSVGLTVVDAGRAGRIDSNLSMNPETTEERAVIRPRRSDWRGRMVVRSGVFDSRRVETRETGRKAGSCYDHWGKSDQTKPKTGAEVQKIAGLITDKFKPGVDQAN